jgi:cytochrome oxidase Cu insertion factor (SCO1/SenC/PrrC family)
MNAPVERNASARRTIWLLIVLTIAPVALSTLIYFYLKPQGGMSYGQLLPTKPINVVLKTLDGQPASLASFKGKWLLVMVDRPECTASCGDTLFALRQYRLAQGVEMDRIKRVWLVPGGSAPGAAALAKADGAEVRLVADLSLPGDPYTGVYLVDPLGNQVMRYGRDAVPGKVIKEIGRLLKNNQALG